MDNGRKRFLCASVGAILLFAVWTALVRLVDVNPIGPLGTSVGLSGLNGYFHGLTGVNMSLYTVTDWMGLVPIAVALGFAVLGLIQWIKRKSILKVDRSILVLGGFYLALMAFYCAFEFAVVNYRPVLINGYLEASYPSSTTLLTLCVMPTAMIQLGSRIKNKRLKYAVNILIALFTAFTVFGRIFSGVHWITDIAGGVILSEGLIFLYIAFE